MDEIWHDSLFQIAMIYEATDENDLDFAISGPFCSSILHNSCLTGQSSSHVFAIYLRLNLFSHNLSPPIESFKQMANKLSTDNKRIKSS